MSKKITLIDDRDILLAQTPHWTSHQGGSNLAIFLNIASIINRLLYDHLLIIGVIQSITFLRRFIEIPASLIFKISIKVSCQSAVPPDFDLLEFVFKYEA